MKESTPTRVVELVVGIADNINFMNVLDPENPTPLSMGLSQRCELVFRLSDTLVGAGWKFQRRPISIKDDFGLNFSSFVWVTQWLDTSLAPRSCFKIIYECARMGEYEYSLFMADSHDQHITLDPKIENGTGRVP
ncbi:hypothetical protein [Caulobacter sp. DWR1-3-2b1]|uniref:hypothetical protein n=1 Tax=Caulobacter sp. DWR1-3-2b1 TaxID=2804670 RepID=UPI003CF36DEB